MSKLGYIAMLAVSACLCSACLKQTFPTDKVTEEQMGQSTNALEALSRATAAVFNRYGNDYGSAFGYPGIMMWRDGMAAEFPPYAADYDYHPYYSQCVYLGDYSFVQDWWSLFYKVILNADLFMAAAEGNDDPAVKRLLGNAYCYRAFTYLDLARMYEFHETGFPALDAEAESRGIMGLTVPLYTEKTTEEEAKYLPRAPFYLMYRFILNDLDIAEELLEGYVSPSVNQAGISLVYGLKARTWLELASRFDSNICSTGDSDLQTALEHEDEYPEYHPLGITSALDCYARALEYAKLATAYHSPLTKEQWFNATTGFNTAQNAWIFGMIIGAEDVQSAWRTFTSQMSPETTYGTANKTYQAYRMIDASLYMKIGDGDWRKRTWIDPEDAGKTTAYPKYTTLLSEADFALCPPLTNFKFHPGSGDMENYLVGNISDIPLMRIEEMYLIAAEATAHVSGIAAGCAALQDFVNTYRYTDGSYVANCSDLDSFNDEILTQRRIEFWGEGLVIFDYRRLRKAVVRGYSGTNFPLSYRTNSLPGFVPPWSTIYITSSEYQYNHAVEGQNNPDPSGYCINWSNQ